MTEGNGELKPEDVLAQAETSEQERERKIKHFADNMDEYVHVSELIVATRRFPQGMGCLVGDASRNDLDQSVGRIMYEVNKRIQWLEVQAAKKQDAIMSATTLPKGGILNFARRKK